MIRFPSKGSFSEGHEDGITRIIISIEVMSLVRQIRGPRAFLSPDCMPANITIFHAFTLSSIN